MQSIEAQGETVTAAIEAGLRELGLERDAVDIDVLDEGSRGILGLASRPARVRLRPKADTNRQEPVAAEAAGPPLADTQKPVAGGLSEGIERAKSFIEELVRLLGSPVHLTVRNEADQVVFELAGQDTGFLIGRHGQMLDAMEYLVNRVALAEGSDSARILLDVEGYRERRRAYLESLAKRVGAQVRRNRKPVTLEPMSPRDRRTIHVTLQQERGVVTKSTGEGYYRRVVVSPAEPSGPRPRSARS